MSEWDVCTCHRCRTVDKDWISLLYQTVDHVRHRQARMPSDRDTSFLQRVVEYDTASRELFDVAADYDLTPSGERADAVRDKAIQAAALAIAIVEELAESALRNEGRL